jgi:hypothetical protein
MASRPSRSFVRWGLLLVPPFAILAWHLYVAMTVNAPFVEAWHRAVPATTHLVDVRLERLTNRVTIVTTRSLSPSQRDEITRLIADLNRQAQSSYDLYAWIIPYQSYTKIVQPTTTVTLPAPSTVQPQPPKPSTPPPTTDASPHEQPTITPEDEEAAKARKLAQLRWLALLEGTTVGTIYREGVPYTSFSGTLFNRHDHPLKHAVVRLTVIDTEGHPVITQDFTLVPFVNPSISLTGTLPPKHRLPFSFPLSNPLPQGWTTQAEMVVIDYDEPTVTATHSQ